MYNDLFEYRISEKIVINTAEFAITQVDSVLQKYFPEFQIPSIDSSLKNDLSKCDMNSCDLSTGTKSVVKSHVMVQWVWNKAIQLTLEILEHGYKDIVISVIVNDFMLPPSARILAMDDIAAHLPDAFHNILKDMALEYVPNRGTGYIVGFSQDIRIPLQFISESYLRNRARKLLKRISGNTQIQSTGEGTFILCDCARVGLVATDSLRCTSGEAILLANNKLVPLCNSIMLAYYALHQDRTVINLADYAWKCGYRGGAIATYHLLERSLPILNCFYISDAEELRVTDTFTSVLQ